MCLVLSAWCSPVFAVPVLQLDIGGGYYNTAGDPRYNDETIVSAGDVFTLYALLWDKKGNLLDDDYYISMALYPHVSQSSTSDYGSFLFDGKTINVTEDMNPYGMPVGLTPHGVFDTYYILHPFTFVATNTVGIYNTQDNPGQFDDFHPGAGLYYAAFAVDVTNLSDKVSIHFDLFSKNAKAPFSHDADAQSDPPPPVPEPGVLLLLGLGMAGVGLWKWKFRK
ncbi:MAG: choice-of-anchor N protein [Syntrophales bacterium]|nr:choice-of-anchor N protein [Syntrophales bacterium]